MMIVTTCAYSWLEFFLMARMCFPISINHAWQPEITLSCHAYLS